MRQNFEIYFVEIYKFSSEAHNRQPFTTAPQIKTDLTK